MATATLTGDLVTDASRATAADGDGLTSDSSVGIYPARTNLLPNGDFEQDTRYWGQIYADVSRTTSTRKFGTYAGLATITAPTTGDTTILSQAAVVANPVASGRYVFEVWVYATGAIVGKVASVYIQESGGAQANTLTLRNTTLVSGWNRLRVRHLLQQSDRTGLNCYLSTTNNVAGVTFIYEGACCYRSGAGLPYVAANEVLVPFNPSPNLAANPSFEANIAGWGTATLCAIAQSATYAHEGTQSMRMTASGTGIMSASYSGFFTGAPLAQTRYAVAYYIYATGSAVGKRSYAFFVGTGGPTLGGGNDIFASTNVLLAEGWNYLLITGIPTYNDETDIRLQIQVNDVTSGIVVWFDDFRADDDYTAPTPSTESDTAGRIRVPTTRLSTTRGWIALRVRPNWSTESGVLSTRGRPTLPVTLWQWKDDANNYLKLTYDGGLVTMERAASGVADTSSSPWAPDERDEDTIIAKWDSGGVYVSVEGRAFVGPFETFVTDSFTRADTASGLGTTETGSKTWTIGGQSVPKITSNRYTPHASNVGNGYAYLNLGEVPAQVGGVVSYVDGGGGGTANHTMAYAPTVGVVTDLLHLYMSLGSINYQYDTAFSNYRGAVLDNPLVDDGTAYDVKLTLQGNTIAVQSGADTYAFKHESASRLATAIVFWEVGRAVGASGESSRWDSIFAKRWTTPTAGTGHIPTLAATTADIGSDGSAGHFCGDILWYAAGKGTMTSNEAALVATLGPTPSLSAFPVNGKVVWLWQAVTDAIANARSPIYLGDAALITTSGG